MEATQEYNLRKTCEGAIFQCCLQSGASSAVCGSFGNWEERAQICGFQVIISKDVSSWIEQWVMTFVHTIWNLMISLQTP